MDIKEISKSINIEDKKTSRKVWKKLFSTRKNFIKNG